MDTIGQTLIKRATEISQEKRAFQPMPGGQPPMDPAQQGGAPMDPAMAGGDPAMAGGDPTAMGMDPAMMGGDPAAMGMDPAAMIGGMPPGMGMAPPAATVGQLSITDFQTIMVDMLNQVLQPLLEGGAGAAEPAPEVAPQQDTRTVSNTELSEKVDAILAMLGGGAAGGMPPEAGGMPAGPDFATPGEEGMGFGGVAAPAPGAESVIPVPQAPGMEVQASVKKSSLADLILSRTTKARRS